MSIYFHQTVMKATACISYNQQNVQASSEANL